MEIKYTVLGLLIYTALFLYVLALAISLTKNTKETRILFGLGFAANLLAYIYVWAQVGHFPLKNLFEVFLTLGLLTWPCYLLTSRFFKMPQIKADLIVAILVLFPAGFVFKATGQSLPPALKSPFFAPHVLSYVLGYIFIAKASLVALKGIAKSPKHDLQTIQQGQFRLCALGFILINVGLFTGSYWAHLVWGDYWGWDPKELWGLVTWLIYAGYLQFYRINNWKYPRFNSAWIVAGFATIVISLLWVNLSRIFAGLHSYAS